MNKQQHTLINATQKFVYAYHQSDNTGHDTHHVRRVYENACQLLKSTPQADAFIVQMSALLHDVDDHKLNTNGMVAQNFLKTLDLSDTLIQQIVQTISSISFSKSGSNPQFETWEQKVLSDADKLDAIGAIGICRAIQFGTAKQTPLFEPDIFPKENLTAQEYNDLTRKENTAINHFFDKLLRLKTAFCTSAGQAEAQKRHQTMVMFLTAFFEEQNLSNWLDYLEKFK